MRNSITESIKRIIKTLVVTVFWLAIWQFAAMGVGKELILPSPISVVYRLFEISGNPKFWITAGSSVLRIACGFVSGVIIGVLLAIATHISKIIDLLVSPIIRIIRATPVASFIILVLLWVSRALVPAVMSALMVIPIVWAEVSTAISEVDTSLLEMAKAYRFSRSKKLKLVYMPSIMPQFISSCLTSQGLSWKSGIAAEVLCLPKSAIGTELYHSKIYLETPSLFAWTAVIILISFIIELLCKLFFNSLHAPCYRFPAYNAENTKKANTLPNSFIFENINLTFGEKHILDNFSFEFPANGVTCISGPSGCGKTSLLHVIANLTEPQSGNIKSVPESAALMFQEDRLLPWLSAKQNVAAVSDEKTAELWLSRLGLENDYDTMPSELSGGMSRRVALARVLACNPSLLLLDEPFNGLDAGLSKSCAEIIKQLDIPVIAVTHSEREIDILGGRVFFFDGPPLFQKA